MDDDNELGGGDTRETVWRWMKSRAGDVRRSLAETSERSAHDSLSRDNRYRLESLEPRILLSGDAIVAELASLVDDDGQADTAEELAVIIQEVELESETDGEAGDHAEPDDSQTDEPTVVWPEGWQTSDEDAGDDSADPLQTVSSTDGQTEFSTDESSTTGAPESDTDSVDAQVSPITESDVSISSEINDETLPRAPPPEDDSQITIEDSTL